MRWPWRRARPATIPVGSVERLEMWSGDVPVLTVPGMMSLDAAQMLAHQVKAATDAGRVIVLTEGSRLSVLRRPDAPFADPSLDGGWCW